jgi:hypothetical protein
MTVIYLEVLVIYLLVIYLDASLETGIYLAVWQQAVTCELFD